MAAMARAVSRAIGAALVLAASACTDVPLDGLSFACRDDTECADGKVCDPPRGVCVLPGEASDASAPGPPDAGPDEPDAAAPVVFPAGCSPDIATATAATRWWCRGLTGRELAAVVDRAHARLLDLEVEREGAGGTFSAALARDDNGVRDHWSPEFRREDFGTVLPSGLLFVDLNRLGPEDSYAAIMSAIPGAWFRDTDASAGTLESDVAAALTSASWRPPYYSRLISIERAPLPGGDVYSWVTRVRGEARATMLRFAVDPDELAGLATTHTIVDVEDAATRGRYDVVLARRDPADPPAHFVYGATVEAIDQALVDHRAHVARIVPELIDGAPRWSALIVRTPTSAAVSITDRLSEASPGDAVIMLASTASSTVTAQRADRRIRVGRLVNLLTLYAAVSRVQAGDLTLATTVFPSATCPPGRTTGAVRLDEALARMIVDDDAEVARGVWTRLGRDRLADLARRLGVSAAPFAGWPGCPDERFDASLAEVTRVLRAADRSLDATHRALFDGYLLGARPEPDPSDDERWGLTSVLEEMVREEAAHLAITAERRAAFEAATRLRYLRAVRASAAAPDQRDETVVGTVDLPTCGGAARWVWGVGVTGAPFQADADRAVALLRLEPIRPALTAALAAYGRCAR